MGGRCKPRISWAAFTYVFSVGIKTSSFARVVSGGADGFVGQNPHTTDTCLTDAPLAVPVGVTPLPSTSYRYHTASKVCHIHKPMPSLVIMSFVVERPRLHHGLSGWFAAIIPRALRNQTLLPTKIPITAGSSDTDSSLLIPAIPISHYY